MHATGRFRGIVAVGLLLTIVSTATAKYSGGSGTVQDPYQIATAADLIALGETPADYDKHFILTAGIDLSRSAAAFDGQAVNQRWYLSVKDNVSHGESAWPGSDTRFATPVVIPTATTLVATSVTGTSATANGRVANDGGAACQYRFRCKQFGGSYTYSDWTGSVRTGQSFSLALSSGLSPGKTYYFAAQLRNSAGEGAWGSDLSFTTPVAKPTATTQAATGVTATGATLNGTVSNDGGEACQYRFRYKKEGASYTYSAYTGSKQTGESFSQALTGLDPGATYYFAAQAKNSAGESDWPGSDLSFATPVVIPTATTLAATSVAGTSATLHGTISNDGGKACQYHFRYKKQSGSYTYTTYTGSKLTGESFGHALTGLDPGSTYYFAAQVKNSAGESAWPGSDLSFITNSTPPSANVQATTNIAGTSATLNGIITDDGGAACEYQFRYKKEGAGSYNYTTYTGSKRTGETFSHALTSLDPGSTYYFNVHARNSAGEGLWAMGGGDGDAEFTTKSLPTAPITDPATSIAATTATLNATVDHAGDGGEVCQYRFRYKISGGSYTSTSWTGSVSSMESFSQGVSGLSSGSTYYFAAQLKNSAGEGPWGTDLSFITPAAVPTVTTQPATSVTATTATLNGTVSGDGGAACQYHFRYKELGGSYTESSWTGSVRTGQSFTLALSGLSSGKTYLFATQLKNSAGEGAWSSDLNFTTPAAKPTATTQAATGITSTSATLNGTISSDGGEACQYRFRYKKEGASYTYSAYTGSKQTGQSFSYALTGLDPGSTYYFAAQAKNSAGESDWPGSDLSFATPVVIPTATTLAATSVTGTSATLHGRVANDGGAACQYRFRSKEFGAPSYTESSWTGSVRTSDSFSLPLPSGLSPGKTYVFAAQLRNSAGEGTWGSELSFNTPIGLPTASTQAATDITGTSATLNGRITDDGGAACEYRFRYKKEGGSYTYTAYTGSKRTGESFSEALTGLDSGSTYYFAAQAKNSAGESAWPGSDLSFATPVVIPTATTLAATSVTGTSATLNGRVAADGGAACQYRFRSKEFGASSYTESSWTGSVHTGQSFSLALPSGLSPGKTYYFAAQLRNSAGEGAWGSDLSFTTEFVKPTVSTEPALVRRTGATLNGKVIDDGGEASLCGFRYRIAPDTIYKYVSASDLSGPKKRTGESFSYQVTGSQGAICYYAARATNTAGSSDWPAEDLSVKFDVTKPAVITEPAVDLTHFWDSNVTMRLCGKLTNDGDAPCEYQFRYEKKMVSVEGGLMPHTELTYTPWKCCSKITGVPAPHGSAPTAAPCDMVPLPFPFTCDVNGLDPNCTYKVAARARNSAGESPWGESLTFTTPIVVPTVVMLPTTNISSDRATINCKVINDGGKPCRVQWRIAEVCVQSPSGHNLPCDANWYEFPMQQKPTHQPQPAGEPNEGLRTGDSWNHNLPDPNQLFPIKLKEGINYKVQVRAFNMVYDVPEWSEWSWEGYFSTYYPPAIQSPPGGQHFTLSKSVSFLEGIPFDELVWVTVSWYGPPLAVDWYLEKSTGERTLIVSTDCKGFDWRTTRQDLSQLIRVGTDFHVGDKLVVVPRGDDGSEKGYEGKPSPKANFTIGTPPRLPSGFSLVPISYELNPGQTEPPWGLKYVASKDGVVVIGDHLSDFEYSICKDIFGNPNGPLHGGVDAGINAKGNMAFTVEDGQVGLDYTPTENSYTMSKHPEGTTSISLKSSGYGPGGALKYSLSVDANISDTDSDSFTGQDGTPITTDYGVNYSAPIHTTLTTSNFDGDKPAWNGEIALEREYYGYSWSGYAVNGNIIMGTDTTIEGGLTSDMYYSGVSAGGDPFKCYCFDMTTTVRGYFFGGAYIMGQRHWYCCPATGSGPAGNLSSLSVASTDVNGAGFQLMDRDYLGSDYAAWQPPRADNRPDGGKLSVLSAPAVAQAGAGEEQVLQTNVFKLSQPALAADEGELLLAWIYDDPKRSAINREQVVFSRSDKGAWTPPAPIWDDGTADFSPQLAVLPTGQALCAWENLSRPLPDNAGLKDIAAALDIAVASYDIATGLWTTKALTSDSHLDHTPRIAAGANNTAMLTWISNEKDDLLGSDPNATNTIRYCLWNGSSWSKPGIAAAGIKSMGTPALAYSGTQAVYVYSADTDGNPRTNVDQELFALVYDGAQWSQPIRLTNDAVLDASPQVVYDEGEPLLVWYRDKSLVSCRGLDTANIQQIVEPGSVGAMDFRLAKSPAGHISLVWSGISTKVKGIDVFTATYDPVFGIWSNIHTLTSDRDYEQGLAPTYVGSAELALAYNKARIRTNDRGNQETYQTDLCVLRHTIGRDLAVTAADISMSKINPKPGDSVKITAVIHNLGDMAEADVPVAFYDGNPADGGALIGAIQTIKGPIPAAGTGQASISWTIPNTNGAQSVYVVVDPQSDREERSLNNNVASVAVTTADLTVKSFYSEETEPNVRKITAWIANEGVASAHEVGVAIRIDSPEGQELKSFTIPVIDVGSSEKVSWDWDISGTEFSTPKIVLCVVVDPDQRVPESNEKNNTGQCLVDVGKPSSKVSQTNRTPLATARRY